MKKFDEIKSQIIEAINKATPNIKCAVCNNKELILIDGFFNRSPQKEMTSGLIVGGPVIPTVALACPKCGHLLEFSVGILGLIPPESKTKPNEPVI